MAHPLLDLIAPPSCLSCGAAGLDLCASCRRGIPILVGPLCPRCALPWPCGRRCPAAGYAFDGAWAVAAHAGPARDLVAALKFRARGAAADLIAAQMAARLIPELSTGLTLVAAPASAPGRRARGYDHAERLVRALARRTGLPHASVLRREGAARQLGAGAAERRADGRLQIHCTGEVPRRCAVVDDVHTTGATLDACARALRLGGADVVIALTFARTL